MSIEQDFLAKILYRVTCQPGAGATVSTDLLASANATGGSSARVLLATVGSALGISPGTSVMANSDLFELDASIRAIHTNTWRVEAAETAYEHSNYVASWSTLGLQPGDVAIFPDLMRAARVEALTPVSIGGNSYAEVQFDEDPELASSGTESMIHSQRAGVSSLIGYSAVDTQQNLLVLDGVYPALKKGDVVLIEYGGYRSVQEIASVNIVQVIASLDPVGQGETEDLVVPATRIQLGTLDPSWSIAGNYTIHYGLVRAGRVFPAPSDTIDHTAFESGSPVTGPTAGPQGKYAIVDAEGNAAIFEGAVLSTGSELRFLSTTLLQGIGEYKLPAKLYGPLVEATRGETVASEVLGSGNISVPFQSFTLRKSPLTYLADPSAPSGRRSTLSIAINGKKWREVPSFYGTTASDQIYVVTHDPNNKATITFGDGEFGSRLPTGTDNVVASYRVGLGGNVEANAINVFKRPIKGIKRVFNPLPASGGEDPPTAAQAREQAIQATRVLGRLVSLLDFEVEAARYGGVMQARANWAWDKTGEDAAAHIWIVTADDGDPSETLRAYLLDLAEPHVQVVVEHAQALVGAFELDLEIDPLHEPIAVSKAVLEHLFEPFAGMFALRNVGIGGYLHRSRLYAAIHAVEGVLGVNDVMVNKKSMPTSIRIGDGQYLDLLGESIAVNGVLFSADVDGQVTVLPPNLTLPIPPAEPTLMVWIANNWVPPKLNSTKVQSKCAKGKAPLQVNWSGKTIYFPHEPLGMKD
jgi:hypothetical protein